MRSAPWFSRSWSVQEVVAGQNVVVLYDGYTYDWKDLIMADRASSREHMRVEAEAGKITNIDDLSKALLEKPPLLLDLLTAFRGLDSRDPRDKIYAFRGLASDRDETPLPDYDTPVKGVFLDYATYFVKQGRGLDLLAEAGLNRAGMLLPSWVPDWSFSSSWKSFNFSRQSSWTFLRSLRQTRDSENAHFRLNENDPQTILVPGAIFDTVVDVSSAVSTSSKSGGDSASAMRAKIEMIELYAKAKTMVPDQRDLGSESHLSRVQTTLMGGCTVYSPLAAFFEGSKILGSRKGKLQQQAMVAVGLFDNTLVDRLSRRRFGLTMGGRLCLLPAVSEKKDWIVWFEGGKAPMVVREKGDGYVLVGDVFIDGLMGEQGEAEIRRFGLEYWDIMLY